jgi:hypothetical protein
MPNKNLHVYVVDVDGELRVIPPTLNADGSGTPGNRDKLILHNNTGEDMIFCFGPRALHAANPVFLNVGPGAASPAQEVIQKGNGNAELFTYQAVAFRSGKKAKGNSDPILIIEN